MLFRSLSYTVQLNQTIIEGVKNGASIAIDGVCQTVTAISADAIISFQAMQETLDKTTLSSLKQGQKVSVERSIRFGDEIGGHQVSGHVYGTACIHDITSRENNLLITVQCSANWMKYILPKGFIAVDGSSLTVGAVKSDGYFNLHLIPETLRLTNFANKAVGDLVNIELDQQTMTIVDTVERVMHQGAIN